MEGADLVVGDGRCFRGTVACAVILFDRSGGEVKGVARAEGNLKSGRKGDLRSGDKDRRQKRDKKENRFFIFLQKKLHYKILGFLSLFIAAILRVLLFPFAVEVCQHGAGQVVPYAEDRAGNCGHGKGGESRSSKACGQS